jgi:hypothetical protein
MVRRTLSTCLGATSYAFCSSVGAAALPARLELEVTTCDSSWIDAREAERSVRFELQADGVAQVAVATGKATDARLSVKLGCDTALTTRLELQAVATGRARQRTIALADADRTARGRALALAAAEFVRSDWPQLVEPAVASGATTSATSATTSATSATTSATTSEAHAVTAPEASSANQTDAERVAAIPTPKSPEPKVAAPKAKPPATRAPSSLVDTEAIAHRSTRPGYQLAFAASARVRWFVDYASVSFGAELGPDFGPFRVRAELLMTSTQDVLGSASLGSAALGMGYRVLDAELGPFAISGYPFASAGATWLRGTPAKATVQSDPTTGVYGNLRFLLEAQLRAAKLSPTLAGEVGRAWGLVARSDDRVLGASGGFFIGASVGGRY